MANSEQMTERFMELIQQVVRRHPRLVFPDERIAGLKRQLKNLRARSLLHPEDRMFLFRILAALRSRESPPTMGELSAELGIPMSSATRMADSLVRAKFVDRRGDPNDRRIVRLCLSNNGRQFIELGMSVLRQRVLQVLERFTPDEQAQLLRLASKLMDSLQVDEAATEAGRSSQ